MFRSIRWRLQAWHTLTLFAVVLSFGVILFYQIRAARLHEVDADLHAAARVLDGELRGIPPFFFDEDRGGPPFDERFPPRPPRDRNDWAQEGPPRPDFDDRPPPGPPPNDRKGMRPGPGPGPRRPPMPDRPDRILALPPQFDERFGEHGDQTAFYAVWTPNGKILKSSPASFSPPSFQGLPGMELMGEAEYVPRQRGSLREVVLMGPHQTRILVGRNIQAELDQLQKLVGQIALTGLGVLTVGLAGGWFLSRGAVRPIEAISKAAATISASNLAQRIDVVETDSELGRLAQILNDAFARLEAAFQQQSRFTADASHELRTPLSIIHSHLELALAKPRSADEYREALETCHRASQRMRTLVDGLLTLARADAGKLDLNLQNVDLKKVLDESVALIKPLADKRNVRLIIGAAPISCRIDSTRIMRVINNLLTNAILYNNPGGKVEVSLTRSEGHAVLRIADTGCGISEHDCAHIFERFYRVDKARSRESGGSGLGLAICQSIVEAHGGSICVSSRPSAGTTFEVRLPCSPADDLTSGII